MIALASENHTALPPTAEAIFSSAPTAMLVINPAGLVMRVNASTESLLNASSSTLLGKRLDQLFALPESYDPSSDGAFAAYDLEIVRRRGARFRADFLVTPLADHEQWKLVSIQAGAAAEKMGHSLDRAQGKAAVRIAAMLAHEIKNPLSGIRGAAQLLSRNADVSGERLTTLIRDEVDRVATLIDRMEGFTDTRQIETEPENIYAIIDHALAVARSGFGASLEIDEQYDPSLPLVQAHRDSLVQVILNLLKNSAETAGQGDVRRVRVSTAYRHGVSVAVHEGGAKVSLPIELSIADDGPGPPPEIAASIFDPFVSSKKNGHGIGLALVDKLIRDMGGMVQFERTENPEMTLFRILLPRGNEVGA